MTEKKPAKRRPFAPVKPRHEKAEGRHQTERQVAAHRRQQEKNRADRAEGRIAKGPVSAERMVKRNPGEVRVTELIVSELARAFAVILKLDGPSDQLMKAFFKSNPMLGARDRTIIAEAIYYGLRHLGGIAWRMKPVKPERAPRLAALLTLALQHGIGSLGESSLAGDKKPLENMLGVDMAKAPAHVRAELPEWLYALVSDQYGEEAGALVEASLRGAPLDLRVNTLKASREDVLKELAEHRVGGSAMRFSPDGIRLDGKPGLIRWPMYQEGRIDVQDEGSQLIARLLSARRGEMICDFCAGAGGKTLAVGAIMRSSGRLYAFDVNEKRLDSMKPRMRRAGLSNVHPIAIRDEMDNRVKRLRGKFDRVLVDAPCTGTGTLRRNPDLKWRLTEQELERINAVQKSVLEQASKLLKDGGRIVYATCSVLRRENQDVVNAFLAEHPEFELLNATEVLARQGVELPQFQKERFGDFFVMLPHLHDTDGFFGAVLVKGKAKERAVKAAAEDAGEKSE